MPPTAAAAAYRTATGRRPMAMKRDPSRVASTVASATPPWLPPATTTSAADCGRSVVGARRRQRARRPPRWGSGHPARPGPSRPRRCGRRRGRATLPWSGAPAASWTAVAEVPRRSDRCRSGDRAAGSRRRPLRGQPADHEQRAVRPAATTARLSAESAGERRAGSRTRTLAPRRPRRVAAEAPGPATAGAEAASDSTTRPMQPGDSAPAMPTPTIARRWRRARRRRGDRQRHREHEASRAPGAALHAWSEDGIRRDRLVAVRIGQVARCAAPGTSVWPYCHTIRIVRGLSTMIRSRASSLITIVPSGSGVPRLGWSMRPGPDVGAYRQSSRPCWRHRDDRAGVAVVHHDHVAVDVELGVGRVGDRHVDVEQHPAGGRQAHHARARISVMSRPPSGSGVSPFGIAVRRRRAVAAAAGVADHAGRSRLSGAISRMRQLRMSATTMSPLASG